MAPYNALVAHETGLWTETVHIGLTGWQREALGGDHRALLRLFEQADRLGFDSIWLNELHFQRTDLPYPSPLLLGAAIFARTERIRVGLSVVVLPIHHPLLLAEQLAQLDLQGDGRLDVGIGRGVNGSIRRLFPMDEAEKRDRFVEAYELLLQAWTRPSVSWPGPYWPCEGVAIGPAPVQQPRPPLYVAGSSDETVRFAVERELPLLLSLEPPEQRQLDAYRAAIRALGRPYDVSRFSLSRYVCIAATRAAALEQATTLLGLLHRRRQRFARERGEDPSTVPAPALGEFLETQAIVGDPDDCVAALARIAHDQGIGHLRCVFNGNGTLPNAAALRAMELFAAEVLPRCRGLVPDRRTRRAGSRL